MKKWFLCILLAGLVGLVEAQPLPITEKNPAPFSMNHLFTKYKSNVYQVRSVSRATGQKAGIGSGFVVGDGSLLATNYHVISAVAIREGYIADYIDINGKQGDLQLLAVDVINDLAVLKADHHLGTPFRFAPLPEQGEALFSLGNPSDLGFVIVEGSSNGMQKNTDNPRILFSGALNPGMSGGPTLNQQGEVVGVNVASQGNGIGFVVPVEHLQHLLKTAEKGANINETIADQLFADNKRYYRRFFEEKWKTVVLGHFTVPTELGSDIRCWDASEEPDAEDLTAGETLVCSNDRNIYISRDINLGQMAYIFVNYYAREPMLISRFYHLYSQNYRFQYINRPRKDFGDFHCDAAFVWIAEKPFKTTYCVQPSKHFIKNGEAVSDLYLDAALIGEAQNGFIVQIMLTGIQENLGKQVMTQLLEKMTWQKN